MFKELSYDMQPLIKSYQSYAYPLGILKGNSHEKYEYCLLDKFITIFFAANMQFYVDSYEFWDLFKIDVKKGLSPQEAPMEMIRAIDHNQYIHLTNIDEYYIPFRPASSKLHNLHDLLIIGYHDDEVIAVGYNDKRHFSKENIHVKQLICSFTENTEARLLTVADAKIKLDNKKILASLEDYFNSKKMPTTFKTPSAILDFESWAFGLDAMDKLIIEVNMAKKDGFFYHNLLLCIECKRLVLFKLEKLSMTSNKVQIIDDYKEILRLYELIRLKIFKKIVKKEPFNEEADLLEQLCRREKRFAGKWT